MAFWVIYLALFRIDIRFGKSDHIWSDTQIQRSFIQKLASKLIQLNRWKILGDILNWIFTREGS